MLDAWSCGGHKGCGDRRRLLILVLSSAFVGSWASVGLGAEQPSTPQVETLAGHVADRIPAVEPLLAREATLDTPIRTLRPVEETDSDKLQGYVLEAVQGLTTSGSTHAPSDLALGPVGVLDSAGMLTAADSQILPPVQPAGEERAQVGRPPEPFLPPSPQR